MEPVVEQATNTLETPIGPVTEVPAERKKVKTKPMKTKKPKSAKKAAKKAAVKKPAKKKAGKKRAAVKRTEYMNKDRHKLLNMHARILKVLDGAGVSLTTAETAAKGGLTEGITAQYLGQLDKAARKRFEEVYLHYNTLLTNGWVQTVPGKPRKGKNGEFLDSLGPAEFKITAEGRKMMRSAQGKEVLEKLADRDKRTGRKPIKLKKSA